MKGWKTWLGAGFLAIAGIIRGLEMGGVLPAGTGDVATTILGSVGGALGLVGIGHKIEKHGRG